MVSNFTTLIRHLLQYMEIFAVHRFQKYFQKLEFHLLELSLFCFEWNKIEQMFTIRYNQISWVQIYFIFYYRTNAFQMFLNMFKCILYFYKFNIVDSKISFYIISYILYDSWLTYLQYLIRIRKQIIQFWLRKNSYHYLHK